MAGLTLFGYRHGSSILHQLDARQKFFAVCLFSLCMIKAGILVSCVYFCLLVFGCHIAKIPFFESLKSLGAFFILLVFVFLARALSEPGDVLFEWTGFTVTRQGLFSGVLVAFKFFLIMITGLVFSSTTSVHDIKNTIQWVLKPVPFIPEQRVAVMIGLSFGFIPILFKQVRQISDARKARCADERKNPFRLAKGMAMPLLKKTFSSADHIAAAMVSRAYSDDRTPPEFHQQGSERIFFMGTVIVALSLLFL